MVFIHGLKRAGHAPWMSSGTPQEFWPLWLSDDVAELGIWSIEYDSAPTLWRGHSMARGDRANNILPLLLSEERLRNGEIAFVTHSFGGLVFEQILRIANERARNEPAVAHLLNRIRRVTFLGTPHRGADLASWGARLGLIMRPSNAAQGLPRNDPDLRDLNQFYRTYAHQTSIDTQCLVETRPVRILGMIVKPDSGDVGLPSPPIPVDADHFQIASPHSPASEVYRHIRDQLTKPLELKRLLADPTFIQDIAASTQRTSAAVARIEERLLSTPEPALPAPELPSSLVDAETTRRMQRVRRMRFFVDSTHIEEALQLSDELLRGQLRATSAAMKADALAWCARLLMSKPEERKEAFRLLDEAKRIRRTDDVSIAEAIADSYNDDVATALQKLSNLNSAEARAASFIIVTNAKDGRHPLTWMARAGLSPEQMSPDGKFFVLKQLLDNARWDDALNLVRTFTSDDYEQTPVLAYLSAGTHLVQATPQELRQVIFWQLPFDSASIPLSDDASSLDERRKAIDLYEQTATIASTLGCTRVSNDASDRALWLRLRDPATMPGARTDLQASMRDPAHSLRRLPLALQFGLRLDLQAVEREIDRQETLTDGNSLDVALARFSMALTKQSPRDTADYIQTYKPQLEKYLNPFYVAAVEIEALAKSGQIELAEQRFQQLQHQADLEGERGRLERIIAEAKGANPVEAREEEFKKSGSLPDLANLVQQLVELRDWPRLVTYGQEFFDRTHGLPALRALAEALFETKAFEDLLTTLSQHPDLVAQSPFLAALRAWALFRAGDLDASREALAQLRAVRDDANDRILQVNLAIASGDWTTLAAFVEQEWDNRADRTAGELLRAGQLARQLGSARSRELIVEAANRADAPEIYLGCYGAAVSAGWEDAQTATWLERAAILSGDNGPVKRMSFKDVVDLHPEWQERESRTTQQLLAGDLPIFAAGHLLNRTLFDLFMMPALANPETVDPRRRTAVYAYSAARGLFTSSAKSAAFDPTALMTLANLKLTEQVFARFEKIVVPHSTLGWLFEERQRIQFHQPSRMDDAREIRNLLSSNHLTRLERTTTIDDALASEVGPDLAALLAEATLSHQNGPQRLVVRSAPVHRIGSLMEEHADLRKYTNHLCGCAEVITALVQRGQLTQAEEQRARSYLKLHETPWPTTVSIRPGARLYLDGLSVTYFQHLGILRKLRDAGFTAVILPADIDQSDNFVRYEDLSRRALSIIDDLRQSLAAGIANGKVVLAPSVTEQGSQRDRLQSHPSFEILNAARIADVLIIDDRHFNQHRNISGDFGAKQIWTTYDVLSFLFESHEFREYITTLRRAGYCFLPIRVDELVDLLRTANVIDGVIVETAELKAIRENLLLARLTGSLQWPKERAWLDNLAFVFIEAIRSQWQDNIDTEIASAKSSWLSAQFDIRDWASQYGKAEKPRSANVRFRGLVLSLSLLNKNVQLKTKQRYWEWHAKTFLEPLKEQQPIVYAELVEQVRSAIIAGSKGGNNGVGDDNS